LGLIIFLLESIFFNYMIIKIDMHKKATK